ncbi:hypothetical protein niasHT_019849 [Heterodera trifolii]|uniref:Uncharacterized protein n=1 Tax=Heterodera trifolii TaxID=157864 RepID=A0ABD2KV41_9BILA
MAQSSQKIRHFSVSIIFILLLELFIENVAPKAFVKLELGGRDDRTMTNLANWIDQGYEIAGIAKNCRGQFLFALVKKDGTQAETLGKTNKSKAVVKLELGGRDDRTMTNLANWIDQGYEIAGMAKNCREQFLFALVKKDGTQAESLGKTNKSKAVVKLELGGWNKSEFDYAQLFAKWIDQGYEIAGIAKNCRGQFLFALVKKDGTQAETLGKTNKSKAVVKLELGGRDDRTMTNLANWIDQGYEIAGMAKNCREQFLFALVKKDGTQAESLGKTNKSKAVVKLELGGWNKSEFDYAQLFAKWIDQGYEIAGIAKNCRGQFLFALVKKDGTQAESLGKTNKSKAVVKLELGGRDDRTMTNLANWIDQGYEIAGIAKNCRGQFLFALVKKDGTQAESLGKTNKSKAVVKLELGGRDDRTMTNLAKWIDQGYEIAGMAKNCRGQFLFAFVQKSARLQVSTVKTGKKDEQLYPKFLWTLVKPKNDKNIQMDALVHKIDTLVNGIGTLVEQLGKKKDGN